MKTAPPRGFTLLEILVATTLLVVVIGVVLQTTSQMTRAWRDSSAKIQTFQEGRAGFDSMTRTVSQATLNTYYDYYEGNQPRSSVAPPQLKDFQPTSYDRVSDLHFISGQASTLIADSPGLITQTHAIFFQAPLGYSVTYSKLDNALNACGYFIQYSNAAASVPPHIDSPGYTDQYRFRLMEMRQPLEHLQVYGAAPNTWFTQNAANSSRIVAENVLALVLLPKLPQTEDSPGGAGKGVSLAPKYNYNSRVPLGATSDPEWSGATPPFPPDAFILYPEAGGSKTATRHSQLPPLMGVLMVVIDEQSFIRLQKSAGGDFSTPPRAIDFSTTDLFTDASELAADLQSVRDICEAKPGNITGNTIPLNYQIFSTDIILKEAKWSAQ